MEYYDLKSDMIKSVSDISLKQLTSLSKNYLETGMFLDSKTAKLKSIYEKVDTSSPESYGPISIISVIGNNVGKILKTRLPPI